MALVSCSECGKEISDAAQSRPHCGHPIAQEPQPQDMSPVPRKSKRSIIIAACVLALVAVVGIFVGVQQKQASDRAAYIASLNELRAQTIRGGSVAEKMCNLTKQVWYNTIYEERDSITDKYTRRGGVFHDDFNTSLSLLYAEDNTATVISGLQASRELVDGIMADLQNPPTEFAACYEAADTLVFPLRRKRPAQHPHRLSSPAEAYPPPGQHRLAPWPARSPPPLPTYPARQALPPYPE